MSEPTVTLQHVTRKHGEQVFHFYNGRLTAKDGLLTIPANREDWIRRAWLSGYNQSPDGRRLSFWPDVQAEIKKQSTMSAEEKSVEDTSAGGQPEVGNRIRADKPRSSTNVSKGGTRSSSRRSANGGEASA